MNNENLPETNTGVQSSSRLFSLLNFTGLQNLSITNQFLKKKEEINANPPQNISEIQLGDVSSTHLDQTDRALTANTRPQGGATEKAEEISVIDTKSDRIDPEQLKQQIFTEIRKSVLVPSQKAAENEIANRYKVKGIALQQNLIKRRNADKENKSSVTTLSNNTPKRSSVDFKKSWSEFWSFTLFFLKFIAVSLVIMIVAEFSTYNYGFYGLQQSFCLLMDGFATSIALIILVHNLLTKNVAAEILMKYRSVWKIHFAVAIITTGGTNLLGYLFYDFAFDNPIWIPIIKVILILVDMIIYALYMSIQRQRQKQRQEFDLKKKHIRTFFNVNVYKHFSKEMQSLQEDISKRTEDRNNQLKTVSSDILGKKRQQKEETGPPKNPPMNRNQLLKGRHHLTKMLTFRKGILFCILITLPILQLLAGIELLIIVQNFAIDWILGVYLVSAGYPIAMYIIKLIVLFIQKYSNEMMSREDVEYICLTFAALPFRFFFLTLTDLYEGFILIIIKFAYKTCIYLLYALILPRLYRKLAPKNFLSRFQQASARGKAPGIILDLLKAKTLPTAPDGDDKSPNTLPNQPVTLGNERIPQKSRFRAVKKSIFEIMQEQERKQEESQEQNYQAIIVKFNILEFVDICYLIALLLGLLALRIFNITHPLRSLTYDAMWQIAIWNCTEFLCEIVFFALVQFCWRKNQEFKRVLNSTDTWLFLKSNFGTGVAYHLISYFTLCYFASNFSNTTLTATSSS